MSDPEVPTNDGLPVCCEVTEAPKDEFPILLKSNQQTLEKRRSLLLIVTMCLAVSILLNIALLAGLM